MDEVEGKAMLSLNNDKQPSRASRWGLCLAFSVLLGVQVLGIIVVSSKIDGVATGLSAPPQQPTKGISDEAISTTPALPPDEAWEGHWASYRGEDCTMLIESMAERNFAHFYIGQRRIRVHTNSFKNPNWRNYDTLNKRQWVLDVPARSDPWIYFGIQVHDLGLNIDLRDRIAIRWGGDDLTTSASAGERFTVELITHHPKLREMIRFSLAPVYGDVTEGSATFTQMIFVREVEGVGYLNYPGNGTGREFWTMDTSCSLLAEDKAINVRQGSWSVQQFTQLADGSRSVSSGTEQPPSHVPKSTSASVSMLLPDGMHFTMPRVVGAKSVGTETEFVMHWVVDAETIVTRRVAYGLDASFLSDALRIYTRQG